MKKLLIMLLIYTLIVLGLPLLIVVLTRGLPKRTADGEPLATITTYVAAEDKVIEMDFSTYLKGVVAAEMPASFHSEALRAQAVAARSYILYRREGYLSDGVPEAHHGAHTCTDPAHCKAWKSEDELRATWGKDYDIHMQKIADAVDSTAGIVLTYNGALVNAVFHSTSSGQTESAADVWGSEVDYLVSVASYGDELSPRYASTLTLSSADYKAKLQSIYPEASFPEGSALVDEILRSPAGGIKKITTGGVELSGTQFRNLYGLQSTNIQFTQSASSITMSVTGNGHGVGMSQYGANYLAGQGKSYIEILKTYYSGVNVQAYAAK